jgi:hypothetical protein
MKKDPNVVYISLTGYSDTVLDLANYIGNQTERVELSGSLTLSGNFAITYTGVAKNHALLIHNRASVTKGSHSYTIFGRSIPATIAAKRWSGLMLASSNNTPQFYLLPDLSETNIVSYEQIDLGGAITDSHVKSDASIAFSKMEALTANRLPVLDANGKIVASDVTATKLGYLSTVTSDLQAQLDSKLDTGSSVDDSKITAVSASKVTSTASRAMVTDADGKLAPSAVTATEMGYLSGVTSSVQSQLNAKVGTALNRGSILVGNASNVATPLDANDDGKILVGNGTDLNSVSVSGDCSLASSGALTIGNDKVTATKVSAELRQEIITVPFSFETNYIGAVAKVYIPYACSLTYVHASVIKALASTDSGFIQFANNAGTLCSGNNLTLGKLELAASTPQSSVVVSTVTGNNTFTAGQVIQITCTKATAGGNGLITLVLTRS